MKNKIVQISKVFFALTILSSSNMLYAKKSSIALSSSNYDMAWINITLTWNDVTLEDLASTYYGDVKETEIIYNANRAVIGIDRKLYKGMTLKIPLTEKFRDQPEHLGWN